MRSILAGSAPRRTVSSVLPSDETTNRSPAAIDCATHFRPRGRSLPYVKMSVFHGLMTSGCTSASAAQWPYGSR